MGTVPVLASRYPSVVLSDGHYIWIPIPLVSRDGLRRGIFYKDDTRLEKWDSVLSVVGE